MSRQPQREPWPLSRLLHERAVAMGMALERSSITAYNSHLNSYLTFFQSYRKVILRQTLAIDTNGYSFTLPTHKTARLGHGNTILVRAFPASPDPVPIMLHYVRSRDHLFYSSPELWLTGDGHVPTRAWFTRRLRKACGMEFSGHSMRAGGATTLALSGTPPYVIQAIGRWASEEWQKYVHKHAYLQQALLHGHPPAPSSGQ